MPYRQTRSAPAGTLAHRPAVIRPTLIVRGRVGLKAQTQQAPHPANGVPSSGRRVGQSVHRHDVVIDAMQWDSPDPRSAARECWDCVGSRKRYITPTSKVTDMPG